MKITISQEECIGCAVCEALCPEVFELLSDGKSGIKEKYRKGGPTEGAVEGSLAACVENAKDSCPMEVISIEQ